MAQRVIIPRMGQTMTSGVVAKWYKEDGAAVNAGDDVYELEYDKSTASVQAKKSGTLRHIAKEGDTVALGGTVGVILEDGETLENVNLAGAHAVANAGAPGSVSAAPAAAAAKPAQSANTDAQVIVIGGGPGGYVAAIRLGILGAKTILVEKDSLGGTCLNRGCIPTKALLQSAEVLSSAKNAAAFGVKIAGAEPDLAAINARKDKVVKTLVGGVGSLLKARKVEVIKGTARFTGPKSIEVALAEGGTKTLTAENIIIAAGSEPSMPPIPGLDGKNVITSTEALEIENMPKSMAIIGGGVIGMEIGAVYAELGCKISVVEALPEILPNMDGEIAKAYRKIADKLMDIHTGAMVESITDEGGQKKVNFKCGETKDSVSADVVLVAIGRRPATRELGLEAAGIASERGRVSVNADFETNVPGVYCIGDANGKTMLAHAASAQGSEVADRIMGKNPVAGNKHSVVPGCIYTNPEMAGVGLTEEQAKAQGVDYRVGKFPLRANGRSLVVGQTDGFVKMIVGKQHGEVLGVHIMGAYATELIGECALAMRLEACAEDIAATIHAHPTVGESIMEAAEACLEGPIHSL